MDRPRLKRSLSHRGGVQRLRGQLEVYLHLVRLPLQDHLWRQLGKTSHLPNHSRDFLEVRLFHLWEYMGI